MIGNFLIRDALQADTDLLTDLIRKAYQDVAHRFGLTPENCPKHPSNCTPAWIQRDMARGVRYFVLECESTALGCAGLEKAETTALGYLERLAVMPDARGKGYGSALVRHVLEKAKAIQLECISIGIIAKDTDLKQWYQRLGFKAGPIKTFDHLPFEVAFLSYDLIS